MTPTVHAHFIILLPLCLNFMRGLRFRHKCYASIPVSGHKPSVLKDKGPGPSYSELGLHHITFLMLLMVLRPQPLRSVLMTSASGYSLFVKHWFWQRTPAGHTCGWHSYCDILFRHSDSKPQGFSSAGLQLQRGISDRSATWIGTFPTTLLA